MRDVNRIRPLSEKLTKLWQTVPDQRMCQFLANFLGAVYAHTDHKRDPFYIEDDEIGQIIDDLSKEAALQ